MGTTRRNTARTNQITKIVIREIKDRRGYAWRQNVAALPLERTHKDGSTGRGFIKCGEAGQSDVLGRYRGRFVAFEIKVGDDTLTEEQLRFLLDNVYDNGISAVIRDDPWQVAQWLDMADYGMPMVKEMRDSVIGDYLAHAVEPQWLDGYCKLMEATIRTN